MELKSIKEEAKKEYPKMGQVKSKKLEKCIPSKWFKIGITSFVLGLMLKNTAQAIEIQQDLDVIEGGMTTVNPVRSISNELFVVLSVASAIRNNS